MVGTRHLPSIQEHPTAARPLKAGDQAQQGRFATARWTQQTQQFARFEAQGQIFQAPAIAGPIAIAMPNLIQGNGACSCGSGDDGGRGWRRQRSRGGMGLNSHGVIGTDRHGWDGGQRP